MRTKEGHSYLRQLLLREASAGIKNESSFGSHKINLLHAKRKTK